MRDGYLARWRGIEFEASPDGDHARLYTPRPMDGFDPVAPGRYRAEVPLRDLDGLFYLRTHCNWYGQPFLVLDEDGEWLRLEYAGDTPAVALDLRLEPVGDGVYQGWAPRREVSDLREERL